MIKRIPTKNLSVRQKRALCLVLILTLGLVIRILTAHFIAAHFQDPAWFQSGSYSVFDRQAQAVLDGRESFFWINDSTRTDLIQYPPGYRLWMAFIYGVSATRTPGVVQLVQVVLDALSVLLVIGIGVTAYGWPSGLAGGLFAALSPLLALSGAAPTADAPTSWLVLGGVWMLVLSLQRRNMIWAIGAGIMSGIACWLRVNPFFLSFVWGLALLLLTRARWSNRLALGAAATLSAALVISPVIIRNLVVFYPEFVPNGLSVGVNLWEGIGETNRGREFGAPGSDAELLAQERRTLNLRPEEPLDLFWPDGVRRDRDRIRKSLAVIKGHPLWYAGVMVRRIWGHLKIAGKPAPNVGSAGINVTSNKCLSPDHQHRPLAVFVNALGIIQSVMRYLALPLALLGIWLAIRKDWRLSAVILATVLYYLATLAVGHSEIRYGLPMQALLLVFAGVAIVWFGQVAVKYEYKYKRRYQAGEN